MSYSLDSNFVSRSLKIDHHTKWVSLSFCEMRELERLKSPVQEATLLFEESKFDPTGGRKPLTSWLHSV